MTKVNYKLLNLVFLILIIYLIYQTKDFWLGVVSILYKILLPFLISFIIAYALYPITQYLINKKIPKTISIIIVIGTISFAFGFLIYLITPVFIDQITSIFNGIISFIKEMSLKYNIGLDNLQNQLSTYFNGIIDDLGKYIKDGAINIIGVSINIISKMFIIIAATIYILKDMDKIKTKIKKHFIHNKKIYNYLYILDTEMENYLSGFLKIVIISFFEYTSLYLIIGHPNALLLGTLAALGNLIPYFGGIITNTIAALTAFVISPSLFIKTIIIFIIFSAIDGYIINPFVYGKSNKIHPLVVIISVFAGGILFGITGIVFSLPVAILLISTYKYFKKDINKIKAKSLKLYKTF